MKSRIVIATLISAMLALLSPVYVFSGTVPGASGKTVIGVILPFSSGFEKIAEEQKNAIDISLSELGRNVEVIYKDGRGDPAGAVAAFDELVRMEHPPAAIISCASWASNALHPLAAEKGIFHIAIASAIIERTQPRHTVRFTIDAEHEARQLAEYLSRFSRIAIFNMDNGYGNNWANIIKDRFSARIVASVAYDPQSNDFGPELSIIKEKNPDVLVLLSADNAARIARQARAAGITAQFVGTRPIERPDLLEVPESTNGLVYTYPSHSFKHHLIREYKNAHGITPTIFGIEAYDAMTTLVRAVKEGNNSPEELFNWYAGRTYTGALGEVCFDEKGDAAYPYMYKQIVDGRFRIAEFQFALLLETTRQQINGIFRDMENDFIDSGSILTRPDFFDSIITPKIANFPVEIWMMQKDGRMIYDINKEEIGKNLFTDELYADYPSLLKLGRKMAAMPDGSGKYAFLDNKLDKTVTKNLIWTTVALHGTEFRLALAYVEQ